MIWVQLQYDTDIKKFADNVNRVKADGGTVVNGGDLPTWFNVMGLSPSLYCSCDSGKTGILYSLVP